MNTRIISFDPGGTTGVAIVSLSEDGSETFKVTQLGPEEHHRELETLLDDWQLGISRFFVVYETFEYRNRSRAGLVLDSREYIGIIKNWCRKYGYPVVAQSPAQAKGFVSDNILKELNLYSKSYKHANDAMRHLLYFVINNEDFRFKAMTYELDLRKKLLEIGYK